MSVRIRPPEPDETPLSQDERFIAVRLGCQPVEVPTWHPAIARNFSLMSARMHRAAAVQHQPAETLS